MHHTPDYTESASAREILTRSNSYALLPIEQLDHSLSPLALILLCVMRAWQAITRTNTSGDIVKTPPGGWYRIIGCAPASVPRLLRQLKDRGFIEKHKNCEWRIKNANVKGHRYVRVSLAPLLTSKAPGCAKRLFVDLHRYVDHETGCCFPSLATIAKGVTRHICNVIRAMKILVNEGLLRRIWSRGKRVTILYPLGDAREDRQRHRKRRASRQPYSAKTGPPGKPQRQSNRKSLHKQLTDDVRLDETIRELAEQRSMNTA